MTTKDKWLWCYLPTAALYTLPVVALGYLFGEGLNPNKVLFSNDGPLGNAASQWMQDGYYPGGAIWQDTYWLGVGYGRKEISITTITYWLCMNPAVMLPLIAVGIAFCSYVIIKDILDSPKELEKQVVPFVPPPYFPKNTNRQCWFFRYLLMIVLFRFAWIVVESNPFIHPVESICWLAYSFLGLPAWISAEVENYEYQKNTVR